MAKKPNQIVDAFGDSVSLNDTYNQINVSTMTPTSGTGRGVEATSGVTIGTRGVAGTNSTGTPTGSTPTVTTPVVNTGVDLSGSFNSSTQGNGIPNFASSPYGDLELTKYLYESGLQNIFSDYQRNIQTLQQNEAQQLQQAYAIRELSKKYLGEYASNIGVGDVSGNLLDIYTQYAQNATGIQQNFAALEMNLTREYTMERMNTFNKILETEFRINVAQLDDAAADASNFVFENFGTDVAGGIAYLDSQRDNMRPQDFEVIKQAYYRSNVDAIIQNVSSSNPYFGFSDLETQTLKTQEQYLQEVKQWMSPEDFNRVREVLALKEIIGSQDGSVDWGSPLLGMDASIFSSDPNITSDSDVYELEGNRFAVSTSTILDDQVAIDNNITPDTLNARFEEQSGMSAADIAENQIIQYQGFYIFRDGNWYRMQSIGGMGTAFDKYDSNQLQTWTKDYTGPRAGGVEINFNYDNKGRDAVIYKGKTYVEDTSVGKYEDLLGVPELNMSAIISYLNSTFKQDVEGQKRPAGTTVSSTEVGDYVPKGQVFFFNGQFFVYTEDGKKIRPLKLQTETE
jgi:hypothetical protein